MDNRQKKEIRRLARGIKASDEEAFSQLFNRTYPRLVKFSWRYTKSKPSAEDVVQESFVKLWEKRNNIKPGRSLMAYLFQIVRNRSLNYLRDEGLPMRPLDDLPDKFLKAEEPSPEIDNSKDEQGKQMLNWINKLPDRQREAIKLSRFEGFDHEEIAHIMEISDRTVNNHIVSALKTLKKKWKTYKTNQNNGICYDS